MSESKEPQIESNDDPYGLGFPFADWVNKFQAGEMTPQDFVSEMEFDGFDGDLIDFL